MCSDELKCNLHCNQLRDGLLMQNAVGKMEMYCVIQSVSLLGLVLRGIVY